VDGGGFTSGFHGGLDIQTCHDVFDVRTACHAVRSFDAETADRSIFINNIDISMM
jgi:hypothetical protein